MDPSEVRPGEDKLSPNVSDSREVVGLNDAQDAEPDEWVLSFTQTALSCFVMTIFCLTSQLANIGIIYYERVVPDTHRTLLNKIAALASAYQVVVATSIYPMVILRLLWGQGLYYMICSVQDFFLVLGLIQLMLCHNELIILHYIYVCKLRSVGVIKEELVMRFAFWVNLTLGLFLSMAYELSSYEHGSVYYIFCVTGRLREFEGMLRKFTKTTA